MPERIVDGLAEARDLDARDPLAPMRARFDLPDGIYLDGNSLGALPRDTAAALAGVVERQWGRDLIASWNAHDWIGQPQRLGALIAPLIGARPHEVIVADTTSANLFKLIGAALMARPDRSTILSEPGNFPTDLYVAEGAVRMLGDRRLGDGARRRDRRKNRCGYRTRDAHPRPLQIGPQARHGRDHRGSPRQGRADALGSEPQHRRGGGRSGRMRRRSRGRLRL